MSDPERLAEHLHRGTVLDMSFVPVFQRGL
jgi:hypothetical protein